MIVLPDAANVVEVVARDLDCIAAGMRAYTVRCAHGTTSAALLPGAIPLDDKVVVDLVVPGHRLHLGCACSAPARVHTVPA